jgi:uncharacterized repeat protein (TIGR01451 family)
MKKLFLPFFILLHIQFAPVKAQWVTIPDAAFVIKLTQQFPNCMNGNQMDTTCSEILNTTVLNLMASNLTNLSGIKYFTNLSTLNCYYNALTSLPVLPNNLLNLNCSHNQLTSINSFPNSLKSLNCQNNQLTSLPPVPPIMSEFLIGGNNISCLNNLPEGPPMGYIYGSISPNPLNCVPNITSYSFGLPECTSNDSINNPNNCPSLFKISGNVFTDIDNDCLYNDLVDAGSSNISLKLFNSSNNLIAQNFSSNGNYRFWVNQLGLYHIKLEENISPVIMDCGISNTQTVSLTASSANITNVNFPVICDTVNDIYIQSVNHLGLVFPGQQHLLQTKIMTTQNWFNLICDTTSVSGSVQIELSGPVSYISPSTGALTPLVNLNVLNYNVGNFEALNPNSFGLMLNVDTSAQTGDIICVHVNIDINSNDIDTTNNHFTYCYNVLNSYDPNFKEVYPVNVIPGYDDWFTYTIHFQNTGSAAAINIRLKDTLDANLDINSFEVLDYSHPASVTLVGNIITVRFNNIMLPDSTTDYEGSNGYFQYRLKPLPNLPYGTQIENTAYIYRLINFTVSRTTFMRFT